MDPISQSVSAVENQKPQSQSVRAVFSGIVGIVSAVASAIFAASTYSLLNHGIPLALVPFTVNPLLTAVIAGVAALVGLISLGVFVAAIRGTKSTVETRVENEKPSNLANQTQTSPSQPVVHEAGPEASTKASEERIFNPNLSTSETNPQKPDDHIVNPEDSTKASATSQEALSAETRPVPEYKLSVSSAIFLLKEDDSESERMEILKKYDIKEIQDYIEKSTTSRGFHLIPLEILKQLDPSKFSEDQIYKLCFEKQTEFLEALKTSYTGKDLWVYQARVEALIGFKEDQLKRFLTNNLIIPHYSAKQLQHLRTLYTQEEFVKEFGKEEVVKSFFPQYYNKDTTMGEKARFAAFFTPEDIKIMLERGGALDLPFQMALDPYQGFEFSQKLDGWKYYIQYISPGQIKKLEFSNPIGANGKPVYLTTIVQFIHLLETFDETQLKALDPTQLEAIKGRLKKVIQSYQEDQIPPSDLLNYFTNNFLKIILLTKKLFPNEYKNII